jgi:hypothetical protein
LLRGGAGVAGARSRIRGPVRIDVRDETRCSALGENRNANQPLRFAQKTGFGERR